MTTLISKMTQITDLDRDSIKIIVAELSVIDCVSFGMVCKTIAKHVFAIETKLYYLRQSGYKLVDSDLSINTSFVDKKCGLHGGVSSLLSNVILSGYIFDDTLCFTNCVIIKVTQRRYVGPVPKKIILNIKRDYKYLNFMNYVIERAVDGFYEDEQQNNAVFLSVMGFADHQMNQHFVRESVLISKDVSTDCDTVNLVTSHHVRLTSNYPRKKRNLGK